MTAIRSIVITAIILTVIAAILLIVITAIILGPPRGFNVDNNTNNSHYYHRY